MDSEKMDRGTQALRSTLGGCQLMDIRQTRKGWLQECLGCEAKTEFKYFIDGNQVASSLEDADCFCRICCAAIHPFTMVVKEQNTDAELVTVERPVRCVVGSCKCCCYQTATVSSGGQDLGSIKEDCWFCVPQFTVKDHNGEGLYKIHQPTCCGGCIVNCCAEGNPICGRGCCKVPFHIFPASQSNTDGAEYIGKIVKKPKSLATEILTDADAFEVHFPNQASIDQKGIIVGTAIFLNAIFFEGNDSDEAFA